MHAIISIITGMIGFIIIAGTQINMSMLVKLNNTENQLTPIIYSIGIEIKVIVLVLGLMAIITSIMYSPKKSDKFKILNKVGLLLGIIGILLCFIPLYLIF